MAESQHQLSESRSLPSLSPTRLNVFTLAMPYVVFHLGSVLSADSIFIFISRQLCGKCHIMDSSSTMGHKLPVMRWYLTGTLPHRCTQHSLCLFLASSPLRAPQGEAAHQELPSCLAPEVRCAFQFSFWFLLLSAVPWTSAVWETKACYPSDARRVRQW